MHIGLACGDDERPTPFERITNNLSDFIEAEYRPSGIAITDPRSMKLNSLIEFFKHVSQREDSHEVPHAFRFKMVLSSRKEGNLIPADYKHDKGNEESEPSTPPAPRKRRKGRRKAPAYTGNAGLLDPDVNMEPATTVETEQSSATPARSAGTSTLLASGRQSTSNIITQPSADVATGLITPQETPGPSSNRNESISPPPRNRGRKGKSKLAIGPPDESSSSEHRKSKRSSKKTKVSPANQKSQKTKKTKTKKSKARV
jgi:hypothetical protein